MSRHRKRKRANETAIKEGAPPMVGAPGKSRSTPVNVALSPRQLALRKLYRVSLVVGALALFVGGGMAFTLYSDFFSGRTTLKTGQAKERVFREPKLNPNQPPGPAPAGMVWIPGGEFYMGNEERDPFTSPYHLVYVDGFWMDTHEVTNEEFAKFIAATKYKTVVERPLDPKEWPKARPELLKVPWSFVFKMPAKTRQFDSLVQCQYECARPVFGACWKHPEGPGSNLKGREKHPVVQICFEDALAYCKWAGKRLPTEAEWEFASRGGLDRKAFPWGDELKPKGQWMTNIWQGDFPYENTKEDKYESTAPVGSFPPNAYGLYDTSGNVWEWCADWYQPKHYEDCIDSEVDGVTRNPQGPDSSFDPMERGFPKRVQRGGSFLCAEGACERYYCGARGKGEINSSGIQIGFRCAK